MKREIKKKVDYRKEKRATKRETNKARDTQQKQRK